MKSFFYLMICALFLNSCSNEGDEEGIVNQNLSTEDIDSSKIEEIETLFDKDIFDDPQKEMLLKELKVCSEENKGSKDYMNPACSPRFFELFPVTTKTALNDAFILQMKAKTNGFPLRRLLVFIRDKGVLVKVNGFVANLIERRVTQSGYDDLVLRFNHIEQEQDVFFNCLFKWSGSSYEYHSVEVIEGVGWGGPVKKELRDSVSVEVKKDILKNKMVF